MGEEGVVTVTGAGRALHGQAANRALRVDLAGDRMVLTLEGGEPPLAAAYRDVATIAVQQGHVLLVLDGDRRYIVEQLGDRLGTLVGVLRERRARQLLADRLIEAPAGDALELAEYRDGDEHGVAQLCFHGWGAALLPLDERLPQRLVRRADVRSAEAHPARGCVRVNAARATDPTHATSFELLGLGAAVERQRARWAGLREMALGDAAAIVGTLLPEAPLDLRQRAEGLLVDGRPVEQAELREGWSALESAVLSEPVFAASYRELAERGSGARWMAIAPSRPTLPGQAMPQVIQHVAWFFVSLPSSLVAMEIVSAGSHATYLFRGSDAAQVVADASEALIDGRFMRAPIYLGEDQLAEARHLRYRLAVAALPSLRAARARFVGRVIHRDDASWRGALDDAIAWSASAGAGGGRWPGAAAGGGDADIDDEDQPALTATQEP